MYSSFTGHMTQKSRAKASKSRSPEPQTADKPVTRVEDVQEAYIKHKNQWVLPYSYWLKPPADFVSRLVNSIDESAKLLTELRDFNKDDWVVRYPHFNEESSTSAPITPPATPAKRPSSLRRSMTFMDDPQNGTDVVVNVERGRDSNDRYPWLRFKTLRRMRMTKKAMPGYFLQRTIWTSMY